MAKYIFSVPFTETIDIVVDSKDLTPDEIAKIGAEQHPKYLSETTRYWDCDFDKGDWVMTVDSDGNEVPIAYDDEMNEIE